MELQTAFYVIAIIYMSLMLIIFAVLLAAVLVIKTKVNRVHDSIESRVNRVKSVTRKTAIGAKALRYFFGRGT
jgi:sulfite exporter TauE/SafE